MSLCYTKFWKTRQGKKKGGGRESGKMSSKENENRNEKRFYAFFLLHLLCACYFMDRYSLSQHVVGSIIYAEEIRLKLLVDSIGRGKDRRKAVTR